uniref:Uncharacterized protein n=1 Tax=viral metagenome TaxID=1070528 RepID=A0A6M3J0K4_9ZZZZ
MPLALFTSCYDPFYYLYFTYQPCCANRNGTCNISVEGGVAPFTWEITGTQFSLGSAETNVQTNTVTADDTVVIGDEETITVTDACGTEVTGTIRCCDPLDCAEEPGYSFPVGGTFYAGIEIWTRIKVIGGCPPYTWTVTGAHMSVLSASTNSRGNWVYVEDTATADDTITVVDSVGGSITVTIKPGSNKCNVLYYVSPTWSAENSETMGRSTNIGLAVDDGAGPFTWTVSGTGFWFDEGHSITSIETEGGNTSLYSDATACGAATITVKDACGTSITDYVRGTVSSGWVDTNNHECTIEGLGTIVPELGGTFPACNGGCHYELIDGNLRVIAVVHGMGYGENYCRDYSDVCAIGNTYDCAVSGQDNCEACGVSPITTCTCYVDYDGLDDWCWCSGGKTDYTWECS